MVSVETLYAIFQNHPSVCTDTRKLKPGCLFFALKGENFDGNKFARTALENGAAYVVVDDPAVQDSERTLLVKNTLTTLQQLASHYRRQFDIPVIAIGGSNGKTTTKELVSAVLSSHYPTHATSGNLNNHIGVPLTLLAMPPDTEVAIIEMGTNQQGDIDLLCDIAAPTHGLLTNIGKEHLEGFGDLQGVKKAEGELYRYLARTGGYVFVNTGEKYLKTMAGNYRKKVFYGPTDQLRNDDGIIDVQLISVAPFVRAAFLSENDQRMEVQSQLVGQHNFHNILTAIALGIYFKVPAGKIKTAVEQYAPANNRSQIVRRGSNTILLDAYNANPSSMRAALETLAAFQAPVKVALLGDMLELGSESASEHAAILRFATRKGFDHLVLVGPEFEKCRPARSRALFLPDAAAARAWFEAQVFDNACVLVKASRGIRLEAVLG